MLTNFSELLFYKYYEVSMNLRSQMSVICSTAHGDIWQLGVSILVVGRSHILAGVERPLYCETHNTRVDKPSKGQLLPTAASSSRAPFLQLVSSSTFDMMSSFAHSLSPERYLLTLVFFSVLWICYKIFGDLLTRLR